MKKRVFTVLLLVLLTIIIAPVKNEVFAEQPIKETKDIRYNCKSAVIMDYNTGKVLYTQNPEQRLPIASMVKIMTLNLAFEALDEGKIKLDDDTTASVNAASMGGSQAYLDAGSPYKTEELIKSIIIASANDSCVAIAEMLSGSVEGFVSEMNKKAEEWGMTNTYFVNCTGLPAPNQYCCALDAAIMFRHLISHKKFFDYSGIWMYDFVHPSGRITGLTNTNKLIRFYEGCDGGKTGFTSEALSCLAATAKRGSTRLISVAIGAPDAKTRNAEVSKMFNFGFGNYETRQIIFKDKAIDGDYAIIGAKQKTTKLYPEDDYFYLLKKGDKNDPVIQFDINNLKAPLKSGDRVGAIKIEIDGTESTTIPLVVREDIKKASYLDIINDFIGNW